MPGIVRVEHRRHPFVIIDRCPLEDERLSWPARGLLGYLLAKPDDWELRVLDLCRYGDLGRDGVHSLLQQLQDLVYLRRRQVRDERGRVAGYDSTVLEVPHASGPGSPGPAAPDPAEADPADQPLPSNQGAKDPVDQLTTTTPAPTAAASPSAAHGPALGVVVMLKLVIAVVVVDVLAMPGAGATRANVR
jgi:hypothetical protein